MLDPKQKVVIGMSGGVDSSVAAALLKEQGFDVIGVSLNLLSCNRPIERSCCSARDREDARKVCEALQIEHRVIDCRSEFKEMVIDPFVEEYLKGRTPSPCILCNHLVKFPALLKEADRIGAKFIATGHYARLENDVRLKLLRGVDPKKDQSYFLFGLSKVILNRTLFPLGELNKKQVREIALKKNIPTRDKAESQEICFVPENDYAAFVEESANEKIKGQGNFVDMKGNVLGKHEGIHSYTIGQRRGLKFGIGRRQYVVEIRPQKNEVVLGSDEDLFRKEMLVKNVNWISEKSDINRALVKIRSTHVGEMASLEKQEGDVIKVNFDRPVRAIAPGQAAVFHDGDEVLGGGWIV